MPGLGTRLLLTVVSTYLWNGFKWVDIVRRILRPISTLCGSCVLLILIALIIIRMAFLSVFDEDTPWAPWAMIPLGLRGSWRKKQGALCFPSHHGTLACFVLFFWKREKDSRIPNSANSHSRNTEDRAEFNAHSWCWIICKWTTFSTPFLGPGSLSIQQNHGGLWRNTLIIDINRPPWAIWVYFSHFGNPSTGDSLLAFEWPQCWGTPDLETKSVWLPTSSITNSFSELIWNLLPSNNIYKWTLILPSCLHGVPPHPLPQEGGIT